jgi:DNA-binding transcriptional LysR family regulator
MDFDYYRTFYYVGKYKSVTLAAKELFTSQPAVTRTIKKLESELGCRLFIRSKKGMEFTNEGHTLFEYVSASFNQLEKGEAEVRKNTGASEGRVVIGSTVTALDEFLFKFMDLFHRNNPNIKFKIFTQSTDSTIEKVRSGQIDVALITSPFSIYDDVEYIKIKEFKNVLIGGNDLSYLSNKPISISEIKDYPFVAMSSHTQLRQYTDELFKKYNVTITPQIEVDSADVLIPFVKNGLGFSIVPLSLANRSLERDDVIVFETIEEIPNRGVYLAISKVFPKSEATKIFKKEAVSCALNKNLD